MSRAKARIAALLPGLVVAGLSVLELLLADRKHAIFSGGFGQSRTIDTPAEMAVFVAGYVLAQVFAGLLVWRVVGWTNRHHAGWPRLLNFCFLYGGLFIVLLGVRYQLNSYFSDAVSFALLKQLGGGSLLDALLYGLNEIAVALAAIASLLFAWWLAWRWARRWLGAPRTADTPARGGRALAASALLLVLAEAAVPRLGNDTSYALEKTLAWRFSAQGLNTLSDFDLDGYGLFAEQIDRHPFDAQRHPLALDVPGNGIDEDEFAGDLKLVPIPQPRAETVVAPAGRHVVIVVMESARADTLGQRVDGKPVAPNLEAVAAQGQVVRPSFSHVGFTTDSLKSIFSGQLVPRAGDPSLFTELKRSGYRVGVFSSQTEDFGDISATVRMKESADTYLDADTLKDKRAFGFAAKGSLRIDESFIVKALEQHLTTEAAKPAPQFLYVNLQSAHFPYHHPGMPERLAEPIPRDKISAKNRDWTQRNYWNAVANADAWLGEVVAQLKKHGLWDNTLLLVTGDHGESLFEDGFLGHGHLINTRQFATFLVSNRPLAGVTPPIAISDYRNVVLNWLTGAAQPVPAAPPFMHIGGLDRPAQIGLATVEAGLVSLRLDTREACLEKANRCRPYERLEAADRLLVDAVVSRWGSERWAQTQRRGKP